MLRSLLNSARGRSAVGGPSRPSSPILLPPDIARPHHPPEARPRIVVSETLPPSDRCCLYCGVSLYTFPRDSLVRCPRCLQDQPARDIALSGDVSEAEYITAGRITIAPESRVNATLVACTIEIAGMFAGTVLASRVCHVRKGAEVRGRILCRMLKVEPGADFNAHLELVRR